MRKNWIVALAGLVTCYFACPTYGDEIKYLPDNLLAVAHLNLETFLKSKSYEAMKKLMKKESIRAFEARFLEESGIPMEKTTRIVSCRKADGDYYQIVGTKEPINVADIKANLKIYANPKLKEKVVWKEIKIGSHSIHKAYIQGEDKGKPYEHAKIDICVPESKILLFGAPKSFQKALERNKEPEPSARLSAVLKKIGLGNVMAMFALDIQALSPKDRKDMAKDLKVPGIEETIAQIEMFTLTANESGNKVDAVAKAICKDANLAAEAKKSIEKVLLALRDVLKDDVAAPQEIQALLKDARVLLNAVKLTVTGNEVSTALAIEPATVGRAFHLLFTR